MRQHQTSSASLQKFCIFQRSTTGSNIVLNLIFRSEPLRAQRSTIVRPIPYLKQDVWSAPQSENTFKSFFLPSSPAFCGPSIKPPMPEVFHICFVGMNKSTVYFSLAFIHVVRMFVVALSLHLSRGRLCLRVHCLIAGILLFCVHTHLAFFFYIVAYCLCSRCRCTIHSVRLPHVSVCPFLWATGSTEYFSFVLKRIVASCLS